MRKHNIINLGISLCLILLVSACGIFSKKSKKVSDREIAAVAAYVIVGSTDGTTMDFEVFTNKLNTNPPSLVTTSWSVESGGKTQNSKGNKFSLPINLNTDYNVSSTTTQTGGSDIPVEFCVNVRLNPRTRKYEIEYCDEARTIQTFEILTSLAIDDNDLGVTAILVYECNERNIDLGLCTRDINSILLECSSCNPVIINPPTLRP